MAGWSIIPHLSAKVLHLFREDGIPPWPHRAEDFRLAPAGECPARLDAPLIEHD
jgi:hypothetical protein